MYGEGKEICSICQAENGYVLKFLSESDERSDDAPVSVGEPEVVIAKTTAELMKILKSKIPSIVNKSQEYVDAFDEASKQESTKY